MSNMIRKVNPFSIADFEYLQTWLEEKSREGLHLKKFDRYFVTFEKGEPCERRYRLFPESNKMDKGDIRYYQRKGWKHVESSPFPIFYTDDPDADEMYHNLSKYGGVRQEVMFGGILQIVVCIALIAWIIFLQIEPEYLDVPLHLIASLDYWNTILFGLMSLCFAFMIIFSIIRIIKFTHRVRKSDKLRTNLKTKGKYTIRMISMVIGVLMIGYIFYALISDSAEVMNVKEQSLGEMREQIKQTGKHHPLTYENLDPEGWDQFVKGLNSIKKIGNFKDGKYYEYFYKETTNLICSDSSMQTLYSKDLGYYSASYYKMKDEDDIEDFRDETLDIFAWERKKIKMKKVKGYDIDDVSKGYEDDGTEVLVLQDGDKLEFVRSDKYDIFKKIDDFVDDIKRK